MIAQLSREYFGLGLKKVYQRLLTFFFFEGRPVMGRIRFFNYITLPFLHLLSRLNIKFIIERHPIFIIGMGRSGTTILGTLLSAHKQLSFLNEDKAVWFTICENDDVIGNFTKNSGTYLMDESNVTTEIKERAFSLYGAYSFLTGNSIPLSKYPELIFKLGFVHGIFPNARFIFIKRNLIETVESVVRFSAKFKKNSGSKTEDWWGVNSRKWILLVEQLYPLFPHPAYTVADLVSIKNDNDRACIEWLLTSLFYGKFSHANQEISNKTLVVDYESLVDEPTRILACILNFCNLEADNEFHEFAVKMVKSEKSFGHKKAIEDLDLSQIPMDIVQYYRGLGVLNI
jgi:hypothetical protein